MARPMDEPVTRGVFRDVLLAELQHSVDDTHFVSRQIFPLERLKRGQGSDGQFLRLASGVWAPSTLETADVLPLLVDQLDATHLKANSVGSSELADDAVDLAALADGIPVQVQATVGALTAYDGALARVRTGASPFKFSPLLSYDGTYAKWVSDEFPLTSYRPGTAPTTASTTFVTIGGAGVVPDYKSLYDAGLRLQLRAHVEISGGSNGQAGVHVYTYPEQGTVTLIDGTTTTALCQMNPGGGSNRLMVSAWAAASAYNGSDTHLVVRPVARVSSSGTVTVTEIGCIGRWISA